MYAIERKVTGYSLRDVIYEYVFAVDTDGERPWRAIVGDTCYLGFESRLEALVFVSVKKTELLMAHLGLSA